MPAPSPRCEQTFLFEDECGHCLGVTLDPELEGLVRSQLIGGVTS